MKIADILIESDEDFDNEMEHADALHRTGFWGAAGAGCLFFAEETRRFMIAHRSEDVMEPNTWGTFGGAIDRGESPTDAVRREVHEEIGYYDDFDLKPMLTFSSGTFRYSNFLAIVAHEFDPVLNSENQGYVWTKYGHWPKPLHPGAVALFNDPASVKLMRTLATPPQKGRL